MNTNLAQAFAAAPRHLFLRESEREYAAVDAPLPIGYGVTNSQPTTVVNMLELLDVSPGQKVLDVGAGSGWTAALLAELVGSDGQVVGVERIPELVERANEALQPWPNAKVEEAIPGTFGIPEEGPFDRILVSAMAGTLPTELVDQLAPGGVMVVPVRSVMTRVQRTADDQLQVTRHGMYSFVPLLG